MSLDRDEQVAGYLKVLIERYRLVGRRQPVFAKPTARSGRYCLTDNFLEAWLAVLANPVSAVAFAPVLSRDTRDALNREGFLAQDLDDLTRELL